MELEQFETFEEGFERYYRAVKNKSSRRWAPAERFAQAEHYLLYLNPVDKLEEERRDSYDILCCCDTNRVFEYVQHEAATMLKYNTRLELGVENFFEEDEDEESTAV